MSNKPFCFVLMPFGIKKDPSGRPDINFDVIYETGIRPAIEDAGMEPIRADGEKTGGIIHKPMFERLMLCEFAVADLTTANANVFYELGVRHAVRPRTTLATFAKHQNIPFDVSFLRALPYDLGVNNQFGDREADALRAALAERLCVLREVARDPDQSDSPVFQLLQDFRPPEISHLKTDVFRQRAHYAEATKNQIAAARRGQDTGALRRIEEGLGELDSVEAGVLVDLFLSYRAVKDWDAMIGFHERMPETIKRTVLVREQLAFACNRRGERERALDLLNAVEEKQGPSSETSGLIGRVYKDLWEEALKAGQSARANGYLNNAIAAYMRGFKADWRDAYPAINAITLLDIKGDPRSLKQKDEILPVVRFAVRQRLEQDKPDYWVYATLLELAVLDGDQAEAQKYLQSALVEVREIWEPETTARNLRLTRDASTKRRVNKEWLDAIIAELDAVSLKT